MRGPVQPRDGFTGFPNEILARVLATLTPEQLRLFVGLVYAAEFKREGSVSHDGRWRIGYGQVLIGLESTAKAYGMSREAVRRALRRFEGVSVATPADTRPATPADTRGDTPPTTVDFGSWFGIWAQRQEADTPADTRPATPPDIAPAPIQQENTQHEHEHEALEASAPPPAARAPRRPKRAEDGPETTAARELREAASRVHEELRGSPLTLAAKGAIIADRKAAHALLAASGGSVPEVLRRWREGLLAQGFQVDGLPSCNTLADLARHWARFPPRAVDFRAQLVEAGRRALVAAAPDRPDLAREQVGRLLAGVVVRLAGDVVMLAAPDANGVTALEAQRESLGAWASAAAGRAVRVRVELATTRSHRDPRVGRADPAPHDAFIEGEYDLRGDARPAPRRRARDVRYGMAEPSPAEDFIEGEREILP